MTNEKIFANEMVSMDQLGNINGGAPKPSNGPRKFGRHRDWGTAIGKLISDTIIYILKKNNI